MTAIRVVFWLRATADLLSSFGFGMVGTPSVLSDDDGASSLAVRPIVSVDPRLWTRRGERLGKASTPRQADRGERALMHLKLRANATTTPRTRAYLQKSSASNSALARELGLHSRTVARWKGCQDVADRSTRPQRLATTMTAWEEGLIVALRRGLALPLDDILEAMRRCLNPKLSRSGIHRCLQRHGLSARLTPQKAPAVLFQTDVPPVLSTSMSNTCRPSTAGAATPMCDRSCHSFRLSRNPPRSPGHHRSRFP
jgi:hypothetical protein